MRLRDKRGRWRHVHRWQVRFEPLATVRCQDCGKEEPVKIERNKGISWPSIVA